MDSKPLLKGTILRTVVVSLEILALVLIALITVFHDTPNTSDYWFVLFMVFTVLSPIYVYVIGSAIFNTFNLVIVAKNCHTAESIKKYRTLSTVFLVWGIVTGGLYGAILIPIFLLESYCLFSEYNTLYVKITQENNQA